MGIRTLTSYVHDNVHHLLERSLLQGRTVIIDGYGMCHYFFESCQIPWKLGGDYLSFFYLLRDFFIKLNQCNIQAVFVFDGPCEDDKEATRLNRMQEKVNRLTHQHNPRTQTFMPVLAKEVFLLVAQDTTLNVQCFNAFGDVDKITLALANQLDAPIVTNDSDFFVLDVKAGCIPCRYFDWSHPELYGDGAAIPVSIYCRSKLLSMYRLEPHLIHYLAVILGCDWIDSLPGLTKSIHEGKSKKRSKVSTALSWLATYNDRSLDELQTKIASFVARKYQPSYISQMKKCLQQYQTESSCNVTVVNNSLTDISVTTSICIKQQQIRVATVNDKVNEVKLGTNYPNYHKILKMVANRELPTFCIPLFRSRGRLFLLSTHFSHVTLPSPNVCALQLRMLSYKIILDCKDLRNLTSVYLGEESDEEWYQVKEYDRCGRQVQGRLVDVRNLECQCPDIDTSNVLDWIFHPDYHNNLNCQDLMTHTMLGCGSVIQYINIKERLEANHVPLHYTLIVLTSLYWARNTYYRQQQQLFVKAACLAAISSQCEETRQFGTGGNGNKVSVKIRHRIQEWQSCMKAAIQLNRLLGYPCPHPIIMINCDQLAYYYQSMSSGLFNSECDLPSDVKDMYTCFEDIITWILHNYGFCMESHVNRYNQK